MHLHTLISNHSIMNEIDLDLELYYCKFYDKDIEVKHTYFLIIPADKDNTTINVTFDLDAQPTDETMKQ